MSALVEQIKRRDVAYGFMFEVENKLRVAMHNILVSKFGVDYSCKSAFPPFKYNWGTKPKEYDAGSEIVKRRRNEKAYNIALGFVYPELWYLDFSFLAILIDHFWEQYFVAMFNAASIHGGIIEEMKQVMHVRNCIAHNRLVSKIDLEGLRIVKRTLAKHLKEEHLLNFEMLVYSNPDRLRVEFESVAAGLIGLLKKARVVPTGVTIDFLSSFSAVLQTRSTISHLTSDVIEIGEYLDQYNKTLPRKPGRMREVSSFLDNSKLISRIESLIRSIEQP